MNPEILTTGFWVNSVTPICTAITGLFAHLFLSYRFFRLTKNIISLGIFAVFSATLFALSLAVGILALLQNFSLLQMGLDQSSSTYVDLVRAWVVLQAVFEAVLSGADLSIVTIYKIEH
ncbi:hypothetical protein H0H92_013303 [Tricholoma furcatifolium]|nr:hypothetical protein H0H92_013303 [Tricholoma furcatifolium]